VKEHGDPKVMVWGTGAPRRGFLYVDDLVNPCVFLMDNYSGGEPVNVGARSDLSIKEPYSLVREVVGVTGAGSSTTLPNRAAPRASSWT
jgi:GDP-L-fucose synthase